MPTDQSRRRFMKTVVGGFVFTYVDSRLTLIQAAEPWHNWAGNQVSRAAREHKPTTVQEVQQIAGKAELLRGVGPGHTFNGINQTRGDLVVFRQMNQMLGYNGAKGIVTVEAGMRYGELARALQRLKRAMHNLASLPHIGVRGAPATGTHGSGTDNLACPVTSLDLVIANGEVLPVSREKDGDIFDGMVVDLGCLGLATGVGFQTVPEFDVRQFVFTGVPLDGFLADFDKAMDTPYSGSFFTNYQDNTANELWWKVKVKPGEEFEPPGDFRGGQLATEKVHPILGKNPENCTEQLGVPGPWWNRLPHFVLEFEPASGHELHTEYFVPRRLAAEAIKAIRAIRKDFAHCLQVSEIRTVKADKLWLSPAYGEDVVAIHFTWFYRTNEGRGAEDLDALVPVLPKLDAVFARFEGRPHWGKLFDTDPARLQGLYPKFGDFRNLIDRFDPNRKFDNTFLRRYVYAA